MGKIKRYKNSIERFLSDARGQRFFNFAYSIGAAIVILGALFKIIHLPGGNTLLSIGMGTEVLMFILTAFDRPPREYNWEEVFPVLSTKNPEDRPDLSNVAGGNGVNGTIVINGQVSSQPSVEAPAVSAARVTVSQPSAPAAQPRLTPERIQAMAADGDVVGVTQQYVDQMVSITEQLSTLQTTTEQLNRVSETLLESYRAITENSENITQSSTGYVEQMQNLNRNISGLNTIYEIQLKSVSSQLDAIDKVNNGIKDISKMYETTGESARRFVEESEKMAAYMAQLNQVYAKMLHAMTINVTNING